MGKPSQVVPDNEEPETDTVNSSTIPQAEPEPTKSSGIVEEKKLKSLTIYTVALGEYVDVLDTSGRWCEAEITKIDREKQTIFASYLYWDRKFDEWINDIPNRVAPLNTHTYYIGGRLKVGQRIEVLDEIEEWLESFVIEENEKQVKIHYKNYHVKYDTWLDRDTHRIRPYGRNKFHFQRSKNAMLWSTESLLNTNSSSSNATGKMPTSASSSVVPGSSNANRVRYIGDERTRKIQNLSEQFNAYRRALEARQLTIVPVSGDGNCLFRSVAHQIYGDDRYHSLVREKCMDYMESEADFFSQFVVGGKETFHLYLQAKRRDGCWGDDPEIEAICELYNRPAEIWAYDAVNGARKLRTFHETSLYHSNPANLAPPSSSRSNANNPNSNQNSVNVFSPNQPQQQSRRRNRRRHPANQSPNNNQRHPNNQDESNSDDDDNNPNNNEEDREVDDQEDNNAVVLEDLPESARFPVMRLSYYGGGHYDSIVDRFHPFHVLQTSPGVLEETNIERSRRRCNPRLTARHVMEAASVRGDNAAVQQIQRMTDIEATNQAQLDLAIQESRRSQASYEYDDLETCLALSLMQTTGAFDSSKVESKQTDDSKGINDQTAAVQGEVLKSVQQQSEMEYLDQAIISSLAQDPVVTDEEILQAALLSSAKEAEEEELRRVAAASTAPIVAEPVKSEAEMMELAMKLSQLSEEEALELALSQSLQHPPTATKPVVVATPAPSSASRTSTAPVINPVTSANKNVHELSEEEQLRLAMAESLQSFQSPPVTSSSNRNATTQNNTNAMLIYGLGDDVDYDEDLMRAIQESLK